MRYSELTTEEFIAYFSSCSALVPDLIRDEQKREYFRKIEQQFANVVLELFLEKMILDDVQDRPWIKSELSADERKKYIRARKRWKQTFGFTELETNIRKKSGTDDLYNALVEKLSPDELFVLICVPLANGKGYYEVALDGRLGDWLLVLKEKDESEEEQKRQDLRRKMRELEEQGEYYFRDLLDCFPSDVLQEIYTDAVNYLSEIRIGSENNPEFAGRFYALTSLIPDLESAESYGNWVFKPNSMAYLKYGELVDTIYHKSKHIIATLSCGDQLVPAEVYLSSIGIDYRYIKDIDVSEQNEYCILALIRHIYAYERFYDGYIEYFYHNGYVLKWLRRLKEIDKSNQIHHS